jgi:hypothetical protein
MPANLAIVSRHSAFRESNADRLIRLEVMKCILMMLFRCDPAGAAPIYDSVLATVLQLPMPVRHAV